MNCNQARARALTPHSTWFHWICAVGTKSANTIDRTTPADWQARTTSDPYEWSCAFGRMNDSIANNHDRQRLPANWVPEIRWYCTLLARCLSSQRYSAVRSVCVRFGKPKWRLVETSWQATYGNQLFYWHFCLSHFPFHVPVLLRLLLLLSCTSSRPHHDERVWGREQRLGIIFFSLSKEIFECAAQMVVAVVLLTNRCCVVSFRLRARLCVCVFVAWLFVFRYSTCTPQRFIGPSLGRSFVHFGRFSVYARQCVCM